MKTNLRAGAEALSLVIGEQLRATRNTVRARERKKTERIFRTVQADQPAFLSPEELPNLNSVYPPFPEYGYDPDTTLRRGQKRARALLRMHGGDVAETFLELGCWDGMVAWALNKAGKRAIGIDRRSDGFDSRALEAGVELLQMDAEALDIPAASVDFAYSYDSFEHFAHPDRVIGEIARVVRPRGYVWLEFGPLYFSPWGEHAYRSIRVPYCQILWPGEVLNEFSRREGLEEIDFSHVNRWHVGQFRELFYDRNYGLTVSSYRESLELDHLNLIREYPACFRNKTGDFDDLIVSTIRVLLRRDG